MKNKISVRCQKLPGGDQMTAEYTDFKCEIEIKTKETDLGVNTLLVI